MNNYEKAASYTNKETQLRLWTEFQIEIGNASQQKGIRAESHKAHEYLNKSIFAYRNALQVFKAAQMSWHVGIVEENISEAMEELSANK